MTYSRSRKFLSLAGAATLGLSLATLPTPPAGAAGGKVTITLWTRPYFHGYDALIAKQIATFEKENPNINVVYQIVPYGSNKPTVAAAAGHPANVSGALSPDQAQIAAGLARNIKPLIPQSLISLYFPGALRSMTVNGQLIGLPIYQSPWLMVGNRELLDKAGINWRQVQEHGWTLQQFLQDLTKLKKVVAYPFVYQGKFDSNFEILASAPGQGTSNPVTPSGKFAYASPKALDVLRFFYTLRQQGLVPPNEDAIGGNKTYFYFFNRQAAIASWEGIFTLSDARALNEELKKGQSSPWGTQPFPLKDLLFLPFPHLPGQTTWIPGGAGGFTLWTPKGETKAQLEASVKLLEFLTNPENSAATALGMSIPPATKTGLRIWLKQLNTTTANKKFLLHYVLQFQKQLITTAPWPTQYSAKVALANNDVEQNAVFPTWQAFVAGSLTPEQAWHQMISRAQALLKHDLQ